MTSNYQIAPMDMLRQLYFSDVMSNKVTKAQTGLEMMAIQQAGQGVGKQVGAISNYASNSTSSKMGKKRNFSNFVGDMYAANPIFGMLGVDEQVSDGISKGVGKMLGYKPPVNHTPSGNTTGNWSSYQQGGSITKPLPSSLPTSVTSNNYTPPTRDVSQFNTNNGAKQFSLNEGMTSSFMSGLTQGNSPQNDNNGREKDLISNHNDFYNNYKNRYLNKVNRYQTGGYSPSSLLNNIYLSTFPNLNFNFQQSVPESTNVEQNIDFNPFISNDAKKQAFIEDYMNERIDDPFYLNNRYEPLKVNKGSNQMWHEDSKSKSSPKEYEKRKGGYLKKGGYAKGTNNQIQPNVEIENNEYVFNMEGIDRYSDFKMLDNTGLEKKSPYGFLVKGAKHGKDNDAGIKVKANVGYIASDYLGVDGNKSSKKNPSVAKEMLKYGGTALSNGFENRSDKFGINSWNPGAVKHHLEMMKEIKNEAELNKLRKEVYSNVKQIQKKSKK
jgi:hypothetical protein